HAGGRDLVSGAREQVRRAVGAPRRRRGGPLLRRRAESLVAPLSRRALSQMGRRREPRVHRSGWMSDRQRFLARAAPTRSDPGATVDSAGLPLTLPDGGAYAGSHAFYDVSAYEGIAFWARRGPEGQSRMIVTLTDAFTSDRLARQNQKYCRRLSPITTGSLC